MVARSEQQVPDAWREYNQWPSFWCQIYQHVPNQICSQFTSLLFYVNYHVRMADPYGRIYMPKHNVHGERGRRGQLRIHLGSKLLVLACLMTNKEGGFLIVTCLETDQLLHPLLSATASRVCSVTEGNIDAKLYGRPYSIYCWELTRPGWVEPRASWSCYIADPTASRGLNYRDPEVFCSLNCPMIPFSVRQKVRARGFPALAWQTFLLEFLVFVQTAFEVLQTCILELLFAVLWCVSRVHEHPQGYSRSLPAQPGFQSTVKSGVTPKAQLLFTYTRKQPRG